MNTGTHQRAGLSKLQILILANNEIKQVSKHSWHSDLRGTLRSLDLANNEVLSTF
jgi:hypothetical protein